MGKTCGECALKTIKGGMCPIFNADMTDQLGCPYFTGELNVCDVCGRAIIGKIILEEKDGTWKKMCPACDAAPLCKHCVHSYCAFEKDTHCPEPPTIIRQTRQGNMIVQQQVINPKRIEATCRQGCLCFNEEGLNDGLFCMKMLGCGCNKHEMNWRN